MNAIEPLPYALTYPRLAALYEATREIHASLDLTETLNRVIEKAVWLVGAERGFIILRESWGEPRVRAAHNLNPETIAKENEPGYALVRQVLETGQSVFKPDFSSDLAVPRTRIILPLRAQDEIIGTIYVDWERHSEQFFEDVVILEEFAAQAAIVIKNAQLHYEMIENNSVGFVSSLVCDLRSPSAVLKW